MSEKMGRKVLEIDPDSSEGHLQRGLTMLEQGKTGDAKGSFFESLRIRSADGDTMEAIAHEKTRTHPFFKDGYMLSFQKSILLPALAVPIVWWALSLLFWPFEILAWASLVVLMVAYAYHGLFYLCRAIVLRRIRQGRL